MTPFDDELRQLFAQEAQERLAALASQLLELEGRADDAELVASVFREAHTLKGSAAVVGLNDVSRIAHEMEDVLDQVRRGDLVVTSEVVDDLLGGVDRLRTMLFGGTPQEEPEPAADPAPATSTTATSGAITAGESVRVPIERLDELVRLVGEGASARLGVDRAIREKFGAKAAALPELHRLGRTLNQLEERAMHARMVPVATIVDPLRRAVRDLARSRDKEVDWEVRGEKTELDRNVLEQLTNALLHLVRNAVDHGIEPPGDRVAAGKPARGTIRMHAMQLGSEVTIAITDDGRGVDLALVRGAAERAGVATGGMSDDALADLIFHPGISTAADVTEVSGRGVGLDAVRTGLEVVRGHVSVSSEPGLGAEFRLTVPITLAVLRCLLVRAGGRQYAIPLHSVIRIVPTDGGSEIDQLGIATSSLAATLGHDDTRPMRPGPLVVVAGVTGRRAFRVDSLVGQREVVVKGLTRLVSAVDVLAGASAEPDGSILLVLDAAGLLARAEHAPDAASVVTVPQTGDRARVLVVDDALTVRELQRAVLDHAGYEVSAAADAREAMARLREAPFDVVLTDVEMPTVDGFALTKAIRADPALQDTAVVLLTSRSSEADRRRGMAAGASAYLLKSAFDETALLGTVERLVAKR